MPVFKPLMVPQSSISVHALAFASNALLQASRNLNQALFDAARVHGVRNVAAACGISPTTVQQLVSSDGTRYVSVATARTIASAMVLLDGAHERERVAGS